MGKRAWFIFVPSTGILYFYEDEQIWKESIQHFRPLYGDLIFLQRRSNSGNIKQIFVPSTGILYFYSHGVNYELRCAEFSSPLRGSYISTLILKTFIKRQKDFRPLYGDLIFLHILGIADDDGEFIIFVPSTGILYFYTVPDNPCGCRGKYPVCGANL